jgi:aspartyl-tRNA(Asn)/glutamyl-tRNA(Gln) amidotransferase subunit C
MSVTADDVRRVAALARLGLSEGQLRAVVADLNTILAHMDVLSKVDTTHVGESLPSAATGMPLRADSGPPLPLAASPEGFAPSMRDGFFLVPRLATHEAAEDVS